MTTNTDPVRAQKAVAMLADQYEAHEMPHAASAIRDGETTAEIRAALRALESALASAPPSAPVGVDDALIAGAMEAAADACSRHVVCNEAITAAVEYALAQQPAAPSGEAVEATGGDLLPCPWCKDKRVHDYFDDRGCIAYVTCMNHFPRDAKCGRTVTVSISPQHNTPAKAKAEARRRWNEQALYAAPQQPAGVDEFEDDRERLLRAFMMECGIIGAKEAGVNLARGIKAALAAQQQGGAE